MTNLQGNKSSKLLNSSNLRQGNPPGGIPLKRGSMMQSHWDRSFITGVFHKPMRPQVDELENLKLSLIFLAVPYAPLNLDKAKELTSDHCDHDGRKNENPGKSALFYQLVSDAVNRC